MLDTIADIRSRLGTRQQSNTDALTLLGIVDSLQQQLTAAERLLRDATFLMKENENSRDDDWRGIIDEVEQFLGGVK